jgi:hypothetical protein
MVAKKKILLGAIVLVAAVGVAASLTLLGRQTASAAAPAASSSASASLTISPVSMATVETVDSIALPFREYELFLSQDRAETFAYFQQHYGVSDSADFWTTSHGGQTPTAYLERVALADATKACVQQELATKYGLVSSFTYAEFLQAWQTQNASRSAALANHQVIYGPTSYSESDYFTYVSAQMAEQLQTTLTDQGVIRVTDAGLESYYNAHRSQFAAATAGPVSLAQMKSVVQQYYVQDAYSTIVAQTTQRAVVHVDQNVLAGVQIS